MTYEVELLITATKTMVVEAADEKDAAQMAQMVCESDTIPVTVEDDLEVEVLDVYPADEFEKLSIN